MSVTVSVRRTALASNASAATTYAFAPTSDATAGATLVIVITADNSVTGGATNNINTVTDTKGNTWTKRQGPVYDNGVASAGIQGAWFDTFQDGGTLTTGDTVTVTFGANTTTKVDIQGSADGTNWFNVPYALVATPRTFVVTQLTITTAVATTYLLQELVFWRYLRLAVSSNTNVSLSLAATVIP